MFKLSASLLITSVFSLRVLATTLVSTPHGQRPVANVHPVPPGGEVRMVGEEIHLLTAGGDVIHISQNSYSNVRANYLSNDEETFDNGWIAWAYWTNMGTSPISSFTTSWEVPSEPSFDGGQTLYLFNSIEPNDVSAILQPVLQYGPSSAGGGDYWAVASWYLVGSDVYYTNLTQVSPGDTLTGVITLTSSSDRAYNYLSEFSGISGTSLIATNASELTFATETLEVYNTTEDADLPSGSTVFHDINLTIESGIPLVTWSTLNDSDDRTSAAVTIDGATGAEITITY